KSMTLNVAVPVPSVAFLTFVTQPTNTTAGQVISPPVQVHATDNTGAVVPGVAITVAIGSNPGGGTLSGTLTQTTGVTGIATFNDLSINQAGSGYSLVASALSGTVTATSNSFSITAPVTTSSLAWTQLSPAGGPPIPRVEHSAVYNSRTNRMTIFGGQRSDASVTNDVWVLSNANGSGGVATWTQLSPPGALPNARSSHSAVYSVAGDSMTIFGGFFGALNPLNDTWVLSNAGGLAGPVWTQLLPSSALPPARFDHSAVYDPGTNSMIVFGGVDGAIYNDVWVLSNANGSGGTPAWTLLNPSGGPPPARFSHTAVYDPTNNVMIVFGGATAGGTGFNDVWVLSNANGSGGASTWTQLVP